MSKVSELLKQISEIQKACPHEPKNVASWQDLNWDNYDLSDPGTVQYHNHCRTCEKEWRGPRHGELLPGGKTK